MKKIDFRRNGSDTIERVSPLTANKGKMCKRGMVISLVIALVVLIMWIFIRIISNDVDIHEDSPLHVALQSKVEKEEEEIKEAEVVEIDIETEVDQIFSSMSLEDKIAQLIITTPEAVVEIDQLVQAEEATKKKLRQYPVSGIIFSDKNFEAVLQLQKLINSILVYSKYPVFILVEESSRVRVENTYTDLDDININMVLGDEQISIWHNDDLSKVTQLKFKYNTSTDDIDAHLFDKADILVVNNMLESVFNKLYDMIADNTISTEIIDEKVRNILEYKILYNIQ